MKLCRNSDRAPTRRQYGGRLNKGQLRGVQHWLGVRLLLLIMMMGAALQPVTPVQAQGTEPFLQITGVDTSAFPNIQVTVYGEGIDGGLENAPLTVEEDGVAQEIIQSDFPVVGSQLLLALDSSSNVIPSLKGAIVTAVQDLTKKEYLAADKDWLAFISFNHSGTEAAPEIIEPWRSDNHGEVINGLVTYNPATPKARTPLYELLRRGIRYFDDTSGEQHPPANLTRHLVVFTDGFNPLTVTEKEDLFREAQTHHVRIHPVQLLNVTGSEQHLRNIAQNTNGIYTRFNAASPQLDSLWQAYQQTQKQRVLTYRTKRANPQQVTVRATGAAGSVLSNSLAIGPMVVSPPVVTIVEPALPALERTLSNGQELRYDTPATELDPKSIQLVVKVDFPDGFRRNITQVEYIIGDKTITQRTEPLTSLSFPIESFEGEYTIRVRATDEVGLTSAQATKPLAVIVQRPPAPNLDATATAVALNADATATVVAANAQATTEALESAQATRLADAQAAQEAQAAVAQATQSAIQGQLDVSDIERTRLTWATLLSMSLALFAIGFAAYVWFNPRARRAATEFVKGAYATMTQMWSPEGVTGPVNTVVRARLNYVGGAQSPQQDLDLYGGSTRLGRDPVLSNIVISDHRVSRYHCRISEEADGAFMIRDEGSTSGTYVNHEQVTLSGRVLAPGDLINIGPVQYSFEPLVGRTDTPTEIGTADGFLATEPYQFGDAGADNGAFFDATSTEISTVAYEDSDRDAWGDGAPYQDNPADVSTQIDDENATKI